MKAEIAREMTKSRSHTESTGTSLTLVAAPTSSGEDGVGLERSAMLRSLYVSSSASLKGFGKSARLLPSGNWGYNSGSAVSQPQGAFHDRAAWADVSGLVSGRFYDFRSLGDFAAGRWRTGF